MSADPLQNKQRFLPMVDLGIKTSKVFFTTVVYPMIVETWRARSRDPNRFAPPETWCRSTRDECGKWLLDTYARDLPDKNVRYRKGDLFHNRNPFSSIVLPAQLRDIRVGDVFADSGHGWDISLLWLVITNFWCDETVKKVRNKEEYSGIQELYEFTLFRNNCWGHHGNAVGMCEAEFIEFCQLSPPTGRVVRHVEALVKMTLRQAIRLGREREACSGMLSLVFSSESKAQEKAAEILREVNHAQKEAMLWNHFLEKLRRIQKQVFDTTIMTSQPVLIQTYEPGCRLELKLMTWSAASGRYMEQHKSYPIRDRFMDPFYAGTEPTGMPAHVSYWSAGQDFSGRSASRRHCALTEFDTEAESCFLTNVSSQCPLLVSQDDMSVVELKAGDYRALVVGGVGFPCRRYLLHVVRGDIPTIEITALDGSGVDSALPQRYTDGDLVINQNYFLVAESDGISVFPGRAPAGALICAKLFISMVGVRLSDHHGFLYDYVPPAHRRMVEKGAVVRLGTEMAFEVVGIRELHDAKE